MLLSVWVSVCHEQLSGSYLVCLCLIAGVWGEMRVGILRLKVIKGVLLDESFKVDQYVEICLR